MRRALAVLIVATTLAGVGLAVVWSRPAGPAPTRALMPLAADEALAHLGEADVVAQAGPGPDRPGRGQASPVAAPQQPWSPADAVRAAWADVQTVPPSARKYIRYFDLGEMLPGEVERLVRVLNGHVNGLSRNPEIRRLFRVNRTLLRVNIEDYRWLFDVYEKLKDADPYFRVRVKKTVKKVVRTETRLRKKSWPGGVWHEDGVNYPPGAFTYTNGETETVEVAKEEQVGDAVSATAPWLLTPQEEGLIAAGKITAQQTLIGQLISETHSQTPIVFGLWFFQQTAIQEARNPGYFDFLQVKDEKTFEQLIGFNEKESVAFADIWREAVSRSGVIVGKRPRRIERYEKPKSGYWKTKDSRITKDKNNPLRVLDDALAFDAVESFGSLGNGFMAWGLFNNKGERQNAAPDFIAADMSGAANDARVHINANCIRCHSAAGIKDFTGWARTLFQPPRGLEIPLVDDEKVYRELDRLRVNYLRHLEPHIVRDRQVYAEAIFEATTLTPEAWSRDYYDLFSSYVEARVDVAFAARYLGVTPNHLQTQLAMMKGALGIKFDPVAATFLNPESQPLDIGTFEEIYPILKAYLRGVAP